MTYTGWWNDRCHTRVWLDRDRAGRCKWWLVYLERLYAASPTGDKWIHLAHNMAQIVLPSYEKVMHARHQYVENHLMDTMRHTSQLSV